MTLDATTRLAVRRRGQRRRRWLRWLWLTLALAALAGVVYLVGFSTVLAVARVEISGADVASEQEVSQAAAVEIGTPLVRLDVAGIAERVAGLPPVAEVSVTRQWPDQVTIAITEREARLAIPSGSGYLVADASGVVFDTANSRPKGLVLVEADPRDQRAVADAGVVFSSLSEKTAKKVTMVQARGRDSITLRLEKGIRVFWGSA
ncbi:MAG: FtsQ-type POTRA domain-containing protein, partial [Propionibacteriaceae bacterium]|nr:FtsQ-type POTRA domain-containing protein [Propionibacteriaceae bacterium]